VKLKIQDFIQAESTRNLFFVSNNKRVSLGLNKEGALVLSLVTKQAPQVDKFSIFV